MNQKKESVSVQIKQFVIRTIGLRGSWKWACKQMDKGKIVRRFTDTGAAHYKLDNENQRRIQWAFTRDPHNEKKWDNANIFLDDFKRTDWVCV
jgi:hypothetical protein